MIIDHNIYSGFNNAGSELGHMVIVAGGNNAPVPGKAVGKLMRPPGAWSIGPGGGGPGPRFLTLYNGQRGFEQDLRENSFDAAKQGDKVAAAVVDKYLDYLAVGIGNIINIFQPEVIVIGGGVSKEGDNLLAPLKAKVARESYGQEGVPRRSCA